MQVCNLVGNSQGGNTHKEGWLLLFPGQGNPMIGMGSDVCDVSPSTKTVWDCASDISGFDVRALCKKGPMTKLIKTCFQQIAVTTVNTALLTLLRERSPQVETGYAGHSAGEYSALYAAGVMNMETMFHAISQRANIMQELSEQRKGIMYVVKSQSFSELKALIEEMGLSEQLNVCCDNGHNQQVVGGDVSAMKILTHHLARQRISFVKLTVNGAWHSPLMSEGVERMRVMLTDLPFSSPTSPVIMNCSGKAEHSVAQIKENLALHLTHTVRWRESMDLWSHMGYRHYLEVSSKKMLCHLLDDHYKDKSDHRTQHYYQIQRDDNQLVG
ncbi:MULTISPECIES: ACP S-malonyltransferase [unclassified Providencia]|uniref:ACP S-malonyltransferase n=1 Tax=unclassified Providencia TaxID=2633465 RepID=UPI00234A2D11|nr:MULTISPECIES: ACP S-malonyltransferase [unclassified Providencia]